MPALDTVLAALGLLPLGSALVVALLALLLHPLTLPCLRALERARCARLLSLAKVDRLLDRRGDLEDALLQLRNRSWRDGRRIQLERALRRNAPDPRAA